MPGTPIAFRVKRFFPNAELSMRDPSQPPGPANQGVGAGVTVTPSPPVTSDDGVNLTAAFVEPVAGGRSYGTWLVSPLLGAPQGFIHEGRSYTLALRPRREHLPYASPSRSSATTSMPARTSPRTSPAWSTSPTPPRARSGTCLIYMNQPLRYDGKAFYQASFGKGDTLSILQVVENPGWLLPYISCVLVSIGLLVHFGITLRRSIAGGRP